MLIKTRAKLPPRTMPKRVTAIFEAKKSDAKTMLSQNEIAGAIVRTMGAYVGIQHPSLDRMGLQGTEDACLAAQYPLHIVIMARDFTDHGGRLARDAHAAG